MDLNSALSIGAFILSVLAGVVALSKRTSEVHLNEASEAEKISAAWERLNKPNQERIDALEKALSKAMDRIKELEQENATLREQLRQRGGRRGTTSTRLAVSSVYRKKRRWEPIPRHPPRLKPSGQRRNLGGQAP